MDNETITLSELDEATQQYETNLVNFSAITMTLFSIAALLVNLYLLSCARNLRRPVSVNLRLCVFLLACDALCSMCYILTYLINIFFSHFSNCISLLLEVIKMTTFTASVVTLAALALNHYVGIVYPLHRNFFTPRIVRWTVILAYIIPLTTYLLIFTIFPGGLRAHKAFAFFDNNGCEGLQIYRNNYFRATLVGPFIFFIFMLSFLYLHILIHMRELSRDPLLANNTTRRNNRKLLITILLLAGSACIGWLPTTINFLVPMIITLQKRARLYLGIFAQFLHVAKLLADAFIYASRLIEIRYAMYVSNQSVKLWIMRTFRIELTDEKSSSTVPPQFQKYLSETNENRSARSRRVKSEFQNSTPKRGGSEKPKKSKSNVSSACNSPSGSKLLAHHQSLKPSKSVPSVVVQSESEAKNNNSVIVKSVRLSVVSNPQQQF
ncbi:unnamed protein product [Caenorhabditis nigoni]|uniref:G-protein coupled receptors family 1 profile domain-containing protein n=1 Tax=Caenorhabditis nigoni TaxID=1611254 RepID=A0A2G5SMC7_9PELO|nr:hypothetical protein B9Z55_022775 [Caenorhabditis nigoni]